jgi:thiamine-phosphate pyrophosphorylase
VAAPLPDRPALGALYPIVDLPTEDPADAATKRSLALALARAGAPLLQLRAKTLPTGRFVELAADWRDALARCGCALIVNDRVDVAMVAGAAGVHLGDEDLPARDARALLGPRALIGYSTHSLDEVVSAQDCGADYLGFGPIFDSPTKPGVRTARGPAALEAACAASTLPVVAIGGVTLERAAEVFAAGAASCAVISEVATARDPAALVADYRRLCANAARAQTSKRSR